MRWRPSFSAVGPLPTIVLDSSSGRVGPSQAFARRHDRAREALQALAEAAGVEPRWRGPDREAHSGRGQGLGGGRLRPPRPALRLANESPRRAAACPITPFHGIAPGPLGAGCALLPRARAGSSGTGDGSTLEPLDLPQDFSVLPPASHTEEAKAFDRSDLRSLRRRRPGSRSVAGRVPWRSAAAGREGGGLAELSGQRSRQARPHVAALLALGGGSVPT